MLHKFLALDILPLLTNEALMYGKGNIKDSVMCSTTAKSLIYLDRSVSKKR